MELWKRMSAADPDPEGHPAPETEPLPEQEPQPDMSPLPEGDREPAPAPGEDTSPSDPETAQDPSAPEEDEAPSAPGEEDTPSAPEEDETASDPAEGMPEPDDYGPPDAPNEVGPPPVPSEGHTGLPGTRPSQEGPETSSSSQQAGTTVPAPIPAPARSQVPWPAVLALAGGLVLAVLALVLLLRSRKEQGKRLAQDGKSASRSPHRDAAGGVPLAGPVGQVHNIGRRSSQQDSLGVAAYTGGVLAVVADGMGGLTDGDKVSQKIVETMLRDVPQLNAGASEGMLYPLLAHVNREVNEMLGPTGRYRSGSTLIAVLVEQGQFQWISIGDSRICLYRAGGLLQMNGEHTYAAELRRRAVNGEITFQAAAHDPQIRSVSSFIGMGELRYIDGSARPVTLQPGDRLLLMSDGVFNTLSEKEICAILATTADGEQAAAVLEQQVLDKQNKRQDNFSAIIMDI